MELNETNILSDEEVLDLFSDVPSEEGDEEEKEFQEKSEEEDIEELDEETVEDLFNTSPESVDSWKNKGAPSSKEERSPKNLFTSIAKALYEEGVLQNLDEESAIKIKDADSLKEAIEDLITTKMSARNARIEQALNAGMEPGKIQKIENTISALNNFSDSYLQGESAEIDKNRKNLIYQDLIARGYSKEKAEKEVRKSVNAGTDIEDAIEARNSLYNLYITKYKEAIASLQEEEKQSWEKKQNWKTNFKKSVLEDNDMYADFDVPRSLREKIYEATTSATYTHEGKNVTAIEKAQLENPDKYLRGVGLAYVLTDGFTKMGNLLERGVKKGVQKGLRGIAQTINNTSRTSSGELRFGNDFSDKESFDFSPRIKHGI